MGSSFLATDKMSGLRIALLMFLLIAVCAAVKKDKCTKGTQKNCSKLKGFCVSTKQKCKGKTYKGTKYCKDGKKCMCCVEKKPTTPKPTTPEPTTTTTTTPKPTTTTTTTTTTLYPTTTPYFTDGPPRPSPGPGPDSEGCVNPDGSMAEIRSEVNGPCESYICTHYGWVLLDMNSDTCCHMQGIEGEKSFPSGTILTSYMGMVICYDGMWAGDDWGIHEGTTPSTTPTTTPATTTTAIPTSFPTSTSTSTMSTATMI